ncbi:unnamed protein product [Caenorhabditis brenneri]
MSETLSGDANRPSEQPAEDQSKVTGQLPVTTNGSNKTSPSLSYLPDDVVGLIIDRSDNRQQLKLRKVFKSLPVLADKQRPACKSIQVGY